MKISRQLNLVMPVEQEDGSTAWVHSSPISREVFETYFHVISRTFSTIYTEGLNAVAGPRVAALMLRKIATDLGVWEGSGGVRNGLFAEIRRLTNVSIPTPNGWKTIPYHDAVSSGILDVDSADEVDNALVFFTVGWRMHRRRDLPMLEGALGLWGAQTSSLSATELETSLRTSTTSAPSAPSSLPASSVPL